MYPICLNIAGKKCLVVGGGAVAHRKVRGLLTEGATVRVIAPEVCPQLENLADEGKIELLQREYLRGDTEGAVLIFAATDNRGVQESVRAEALESGRLFNIADDPLGCSFQVPAVVRQGDLLISVSTNGKSPALAAMVRKQLEGEFGEEYRELLAIITRLRQELKGSPDSYPERRKLFEEILHPDIVEWLRLGRTDLLSAHISGVLGSDYNMDLSWIEEKRT
ncbi:MAG: bifunctional precorrin-2 dehydrogenase/sirohydrochlorin ferrochelatase [Desulfobulbaceae bacterium]|nr:bifunctional precorrin-2 dehydrogenase/sirohydrochlorin ferrochelatase [Desulfobulbaceae bacterium]